MSSWRIVGWIDNSEWESVYYNLFFGEKNEKREALDQIAVWRARFSGRIPVAVEATAQLIESHMHDENVSDAAKRQSMAIAVSQFVGLLTERSLKGQGYHTPIHVRGEELGIPEWVVNLRHEAAHGFLPSFLMLNKAVHFSIEWLRIEHWEKHLKKQKEKSEFIDDADSLDEKLVIALKKCMSDATNKPTQQKNSMQRLNSLISGRKTSAKKLVRILLDCNFIPINFRDENSLIYTQGQMTKLTSSAEKMFTKIFDILKNCNVFDHFLLKFSDELGYSFVSSELKNIWVKFVLKISSDYTFCNETLKTITTRLTNAGVPESVMKTLQSQHKDGVSETSLDLFPEVTQYTAIDNPQSYSIQKSWTLCEVDFGNCPLGLMPGQQKTDIWQDLAGNLLQSVHGIDKTYESIEYGPSFVDEPISNGFTQQQVNFLKEAIDIL